MNNTAQLRALVKTLTEALTAAYQHLDYCGYGDRWERQCAQYAKLPETIQQAIKDGNDYLECQRLPKEKTVTAALREHLYEQLGLLRPTFEELWESEWSPEFEKGMRYRLVMGALRYGKLGAPFKPQYDRVKRAKDLWQEYDDTRNCECLLDAGNMSLLEYVEGAHPKRHFKATDDGEHVTAVDNITSTAVVTKPCPVVIRPKRPKVEKSITNVVGDKE